MFLKPDSEENNFDCKGIMDKLLYQLRNRNYIFTINEGNSKNAVQKDAFRWEASFE